MSEVMKRGWVLGTEFSPEHRAAISAGNIAHAVHRRGFTDQDVIEYYKANHSIRETAVRFRFTFQRVSQILIKRGESRPRGSRIDRGVRS